MKAGKSRNQIMQVEEYLQLDLQNEQYAGVWMPNALARKYPSANKSLAWQYLFPFYKLSSDPEPARYGVITSIQHVLEKRLKRH